MSFDSQSAHCNEILITYSMFNDLIENIKGFEINAPQYSSVDLISYPINISFTFETASRIGKKKKKGRISCLKASLTFKICFGRLYPSVPLNLVIENSSNLTSEDLDDLKKTANKAIKDNQNQPQIINVVTAVKDCLNSIVNYQSKKKSPDCCESLNQPCDSIVTKLKNEMLDYFENNLHNTKDLIETSSSTSEEHSFSEQVLDGKFSLGSIVSPIIESNSVLMHFPDIHNAECKNISIIKGNLIVDEDRKLDSIVKSYSAFNINAGTPCKITEWSLSKKTAKKSTLKDLKMVVDKIVLLHAFDKMQTYFVKILSFHVDEIKGKTTIRLVEDIPGENYSSVRSLCRVGYFNFGNPDEFSIFSSKKSILNLKSFAKYMLDAISFLFEHELSHGVITYDNTFIHPTGSILLSNYVFYHRISDLFGISHSSELPCIPKKQSNLLRDLYHIRYMIWYIITSTYEEKWDIFDSVHESDENLCNLVLQLKDFLICLSNDDASIDFLKKHQFLQLSCVSYIKQFEDEKSELNKNRWINLDMCDKTPRLFSDFDQLTLIEQGGFGCVLKARNVIENRHYAIKCVKVDPGQSELLIREIRTLSSLHHENIVRYYTSWKDAFDEQLPDCRHIKDLRTNKDSTFGHACESLSTDKALVQSSGWIQVLPKNHKKDDLVMKNQEHSVHMIKHDNFAHNRDESWFSDINSLSSKNCEKLSKLWDGSSTSSSDSEQPEESSSTSSSSDDLDSKPYKAIPYIIIQMELCEERTLRRVIDSGQLIENIDRAWALFRELLDGLAYIHAQGVIHRDLKPANIMLNSQDHVKIGDFGLATWTTKAIIMAAKKEAFSILKPNTSINSNEELQSKDLSDKKFSSRLANEMTRNVGTYLYVSPEVIEENSTHSNIYNERVDIYSLGVILFELFYRPIETVMERVLCLSDLRKSSIEFPLDWQIEKLSNQTKLIKLMMKHDPLQRPSASDLLASVLVPPLKSTEYAFRKQVLDTLKNSNSRMYKFITFNLFNTSCSNVTDYLFDLTHVSQLKELQLLSPSMVKRFPITADAEGETANSQKSISFSSLIQVISIYDSIYREICTVVEHIFLSFSAVKLEPNLLLPVHSTNSYSNISSESPILLDIHGTPVALTQSLHINFARLVSRCGTLLPKEKRDVLRRYQIAKVYAKSQHYLNLKARHIYPHNEENDKASYDILFLDNKTQCFVELIDVLQMITDVFFPLTDKCSVKIFVNHTDFTKAMMAECGLSSADESCSLWKSLSEQTDHSIYVKRGDGNYVYKNINRFMKFETKQPNDMKSLFSHLSTKVDTSNLITSAMRSMQSFLRQIDSLCSRKSFEIIFTPRVVHPYNLYRGIVFSCVVEKADTETNIISDKTSKRQRRSLKDKSLISNNLNKVVLAQGGRYEWLVEKFKLNPLYEEMLDKLSESITNFKDFSSKNYRKKERLTFACGMTLNLDNLMKYFTSNLMSSSFRGSMREFMTEFLSKNKLSIPINLNSPKLLICWQCKYTSSIPIDACLVNTINPLRLARDLAKRIRFLDSSLTNVVIETLYEENRDPIELASERNADALIHISFFIENNPDNVGRHKSIKSSDERRQDFAYVLYKMWCLSEGNLNFSYLQDLLVSFFNFKTVNSSYLGGDTYQFNNQNDLIVQLRQHFNIQSRVMCSRDQISRADTCDLEHFYLSDMYEFIQHPFKEVISGVNKSEDLSDGMPKRYINHRRKRLNT